MRILLVRFQRLFTLAGLLGSGRGRSGWRSRLRLGIRRDTISSSEFLLRVLVVRDALPFRGLSVLVNFMIMTFDLAVLVSMRVSIQLAVLRIPFTRGRA